MTDDDIDKDLKEKWIEFLNPYNSESINQQINKFANLTEIERNVSDTKENLILLWAGMNKHLQIWQNY